MVLDIVGTLTNKQKKQPMLNQVFFTSARQDQRNFNGGFNYRKYWKWFKSRPELYSVLNIPIVDTVGGKVEFTDLDGKALGRNKRLAAEKFWKENQVRETLKAIEFDRYLTGDGYGFKSILSDDQKKKARVMLRKESLSLASKYSDKFKMKEEFLADYLFYKALKDEDLSGPKSFSYVASSTMQIMSNTFQITGYKQISNGKEIDFSTEEIIHLVLNWINGEIQGYSPVESMVYEMFLIKMIKDNMVAFFQNGASPSKIYSLPDVRNIDDPGYRRLIELLKEAKSVVNSNGSLIYAGKLQVDELGVSPKDLEYKDLAMWMVSNIAFAFQIPSTRIPYLLTGSGGTANKGDAGGVSDAGYWRMIETQQDYLEDTYNSQLFSKLGFNIKFVRGNKQDQIRDVQYQVQKFDGVAKVQQILKQQKHKLTKDKLLMMLDFAEDDVEEMTEEELMEEMEAKLPGNRQSMSNDDTMRNEVTKNRAARKKVEADASELNRKNKEELERVKLELENKELQEELNMIIKQKELDLIKKKQAMIDKLNKEIEYNDE